MGSCVAGSLLRDRLICEQSRGKLPPCEQFMLDGIELIAPLLQNTVSLRTQYRPIGSDCPVGNEFPIKFCIQNLLDVNNFSDVQRQQVPHCLIEGRLLVQFERQMWTT